MKEKSFFALIKSAYRPDIVAQLAQGAKEVLQKAGAEFREIEVSGSLEIPACIALLRAGTTRYDGYIALGCLMKGATIHDEVIAYTVFPAINRLAMEHGLAIGNGILTVASEAQALERADPKQQNRGGEAAKAALRMLEISRGEL